LLERQELEIPVVDPAITFHDSIQDELASAPFMAGHASIAVHKEIDVGLAELWIIARNGYSLVAFFTLE
jgi:hypothetical protein